MSRITLRKTKQAASLKRRIINLALTTITLSTILNGIIIAISLNNFENQGLANYLYAYIDSLITRTDIDSNNNIKFDNDATINKIPIFWQITANNKKIAKSNNLQDWISVTNIQDREIHEYQLGEGTDIVLTKRTTTFPGNIQIIYLLGIAQSTSNAILSEARHDFTITISIAMIILAFLVVGVAAYLQITATIKPLRQIKTEIIAIQNGTKNHIDGIFPKEISELSTEINNLLKYNINIINRYQNFAANLSHSLKTPLTVINNILLKRKAPIYNEIKDQTSQMLAVIDRNLSRVKITNQIIGDNTIHKQVELNSILTKIATNFSKLYNRKSTLDLAEAGITAQAQETDLYEVFGNIIENACKYSKSQILIKTKIGKNNSNIIIEDDGNGIKSAEKAKLLKYGIKLDITKPGQGIGLAMADEIIKLYHGKIELLDSSLGGLKVKITIPSRNL